jgi:mycothiol system anti-sigma-R factor
MTDCRETVEQLYQYLDRELTPEEAREVQAHLSRCPSCYELERFESGVIKLVRRDCGSEKAPRRLRERLRSMPLP